MKTHRVNVDFTEQEYTNLRLLATKKGKSMADIIRSAVRFDAWFYKTIDEGGKILVSQDGKIREIVRP